MMSTGDSPFARTKTGRALILVNLHPSTSSRPARIVASPAGAVI